jgi:hypothetical protein
MTIKKAMLNPLGVTMGCRDFKIPKFWRDQITQIDRLEISNYVFEESHRLAKEYLLEHPEYSHLLIMAEDVIITKDHVDLLLKDYEDTQYPVLCGYVNLGFSSGYMSLNTVDMRGLQVRHTRQYQFPSIIDILNLSDACLNELPFQKVFFQGKALMLVTRDVMHTVSFKPYIHWFDIKNRRRFGEQNAKKGTMFDLQFAIDCANLGIPVYVDLRLMLLHFGDTDTLINVQGKERTVTLIRKDGSTKLIRQEPPYF